MFVRAPALPAGATLRTGTMLPPRRSSVLLACALALGLGLTAPAAAAPPPRSAVVAVAAPLAEQWSWHEFLKFWERQAAKTSGVVGIVLLVALGATLLILSKSRV
jgi:hypothetical protein